MFGGDAYGPTAELWSLRGLAEGEGPPQWTQLSLQGPQPAPRRGHAAAGALLTLLSAVAAAVSPIPKPNASDLL